MLSTAIRPLSSPALSGKITVPILFNGEWQELSIKDWSDSSVWGGADLGVVTWTGSGYEIIRAPLPYLAPFPVQKIIKVKTPAAIFSASAQTQLLAPLRFSSSGLPPILHPLLRNTQLIEMSSLRFGLSISCITPSEYLLIRDLDDLLLTKSIATTQVEATKEYDLSEYEDTYPVYTIKIPPYRNFLTSAGIFISA